jgi:hypothetical protein
LLRYRFQPGQEFRYRMTVSGDMGMSLGGMVLPPGGGAPPKIPMTLNGTYEWLQKVKSVSPEGAATVSLGLEKLEMNSGAMGMNVVMRLGAGGKLETLMNGQPALLPGAPPAQQLPNPLYEATIDPTGRISVPAEATRSISQLFGGQNIASLFNGGMPGMGMVVLPADRIRPGETWESKTQIQVPVPTPGPPGAGAAGPGAGTVPVSCTVQNKLLRVENGRAVIESRVTTALPAGSKLSLPAGAGALPGMSMALEKLDQSMTGTQRLHLEQGTIEGGDFDIKTAMTMEMGLPPGLPGLGPEPMPLAPGEAAPPGGAAPAPAPGPGGPPTGLKLGADGTIKVKLDRVTAAAPKPAPVN